MNTAVLVVQMVVAGVNIQYVHPVQDHGYLNYTYCLDYRDTLRDRWKDEAEIIYLDCPNWWSQI